MRRMLTGASNPRNTACAPAGHGRRRCTYLIQIVVEGPHDECRLASGAGQESRPGLPASRIELQTERPDEIAEGSATRGIRLSKNAVPVVSLAIGSPSTNR